MMKINSNFQFPYFKKKVDILMYQNYKVLSSPLLKNLIKKQ